MQIMKLSNADRTQLLQSLARMPEELRAEFAQLEERTSKTRGPHDLFSPVEQAWHLADLEREGFGFRIRALLSKDHPHLADFDGTAIASARNYRARSLQAGLAAFAEARRENLGLLETLTADDWLRAGTQDGVGAVSLCDIPGFMLQHDAAHRAEIAQWREHAAPGS